jgi:hypothetical protein
VVERVSIEVQDPVSDGRAGAVEWRLGPRWGADGVWSWSDALGLVVGAQVTALRPSIVIDVRNETVERAPPFSWGLFLGLRYSP